MATKLHRYKYIQSYFKTTTGSLKDFPPQYVPNYVKTVYIIGKDGK